MYDQETGLYHLQSRYYNPDWGRFISADALVSTGQGLLGNNMFAYCNNNPVNGYDPSGKACLMTSTGNNTSFYIELNTYLGAGGGCCGGRGLTNIRVSDSGALSDHQERFYGGISHGRILPWEYDFFNIAHKDFVIAEANIALFEGVGEWGPVHLTMARFFSAEASASITGKDGLSCGAMLSIVSTGLEIDCGFVVIELIGSAGAVGGKLSVNAEGFSLGATYAGVGGECIVRWDIE